MHDLIIVGSGPAGLTAALYARRAEKSVLILEKAGFGGQMTFSPKIENYPGFPSVSGNELADVMVEQVLAQGAELELEEALSIDSHDGIFTVTTDCGKRDAKAVILATGAKHRMLGLDREEDFTGEGISYCAVCDGAFYKGKKIAMVGGGNSALQEAILLSELCEHVTIIQNLDFLTGEKKLCDIIATLSNVDVLYGRTVTGLVGDDTLTAIEITKTATGEKEIFPLEGLFVAIGLEPENTAFQNLVELDKVGYIVSDERCLTATPGIYTAGDCRTKGIRQVSTAIADGTAAALAAIRYIDSL
ncbi:MAG: FAD-dependent oxidoreductase [Clostridia bacterium]|nr:FAD-dependent oxidoreductase [Clostridia bacterium]